MKKTLLACCVAFVAQTFAAEVVLEKNGVTLTDEEMLAAASDLSEYELEDMRKRPAMLRTFIEEQFDNKVMMTAIAEELENDKDYAIIRDMTLAKFANTHYIKQKALAKINEVKDFKTLAKQTYQSEIKKYQLPQTYDYYHILFVKQSWVDAKAKAESVLAGIKADQISLAEAAKQYYSVLSGTNKDGILEKVKIEQLMKPIQKSIDGMKLGEVSDIVETEVGYHIIGLKNINQVVVAPYDDKIEKKIILDIKTKIYRSVYGKIMDKYRGPEGLTVNEALLETVFEKVLMPEKP